jgi:hypothetical protein
MQQTANALHFALIFLFFYDAVSVSGFVASDGGMTDE